MSEDPIGIASKDFNFYRYVTNGPLMKTDPTGLIENPWAIFSRAEEKTDKWFSTLAQKNDAADAFRHCYASCEMVKENGYAAALLAGNAHEMAGNMDGQPKCEEDMDKRNNAIGRLFGNGTGSCENKCFDAAVTGVLTTLK